MSHGVGGFLLAGTTTRSARRRERKPKTFGIIRLENYCEFRAPFRSLPEPRAAEKEKTRSGPADVPICRRPRRDPREERAGTTALSHDRAAELAARGEVTRHAKETARRTCCWFAPGWRYSVRSCKIWSMPACCGCHMGGGGGAAMLSPRPRPRRVSVDRSSRDGDGQTVGSRLVKGGTVRRRAPLAVRPDVSIDHPRRRKLVAWRAARVSAVASSAPSWERFSAVKRLLRNLFLGGSAVHVRALVRPCPAAHAPRVPSRDARTMRWPRRSPSAYPRTCCGSSRCVFRSSVARVRGFPAIPKRAILFRGRRRRRGRADRARALARSPSRTRAPPITHAVLPSALPRAPSPFERHPTQLGNSHASS